MDVQQEETPDQLRYGYDISEAYPEPLEFSPLQVVHLDRHNTAHVVAEGRTRCNQPITGLRQMLWLETADPAKKPWPAWACQTCAAHKEPDGR